MSRTNVETLNVNHIILEKPASNTQLNMFSLQLILVY